MPNLGSFFLPPPPSPEPDPWPKNIPDPKHWLWVGSDSVLCTAPVRVDDETKVADGLLPVLLVLRVEALLGRLHEPVRLGLRGLNHRPG